MKHTNSLLLLLILSMSFPLFGFKLVGLVPVRNEEIMIGQCLKSLSQFTDAIVVLDDYSTDETVTIIKSLAEECHVERIIQKDSWYRDEPGDKNKLLQAGREIGGTHFIMIDADEMLTANLLENNLLRNGIQNMQPGDTMSLNWIHLWRSTQQYRSDDFLGMWAYKTIIFADNKTASYNSEFIHTLPFPSGLEGKHFRLNGNTYGLLHFQHVNWRNLLIKQAWYRCLEQIRFVYKSAKEINQKYAASKDETNLRLETANPAWFAGYPFFDASIFEKPEQWREQQIVEWFSQYGKNYFKDLDIWDISWEEGLS